MFFDSLFHHVVKLTDRHALESFNGILYGITGITPMHTQGQAGFGIGDDPVSTQFTAFILYFLMNEEVSLFIIREFDTDQPGRRDENPGAFIVLSTGQPGVE